MNFNSFFRGDNPIFRWCSQVTDLILLSVMWVFCSLPLVTMGGATAALYFSIVKGLRAGEVLPYRRFLHSFKENWKQGVPATLISAAAIALLAVGVTILRQAASAESRYVIPYAAYYFACVLPVGVVCYLFPLLGRFTFGLKQLFTTALALTVRHLPSTVAAVIVMVLTAKLCVKYPMALFLLPSLAMLLLSFLFERIFQKYI